MTSFQATAALVLPMLLATPTMAEDILLTDVPPGDVSNWDRVDDPAKNPVLTTEEITSPEDGSTALRLSVTGNSLSTCQVKGLERVFDVGPTSSLGSELEVYLEFAFNDTFYNLPHVQVTLLDSGGNGLGGHTWYGAGVIGGYHQDLFNNEPAATELPSAAGRLVLDFADFGATPILYEKIRILLANYTCVGTNSTVFDNLLLRRPAPDTDSDGYTDEFDNCPTDPNPDQTDTDANGVGDACNSAEDQDGDEFADGLDNCPNDANADQADADSDDLGDVCDPFPDDPENVLRQCELDLSDETADQDTDGVRDLDDDCPGTAGGPVDRQGCSLEQFCASIDATTRDGRRICKKADWQNDEPIMRSRDRDCTRDKQGAGVEDDICVPYAP